MSVSSISLGKSFVTNMICFCFAEIDLCDDNPCENDEECTVLDDETVYCDCSEQFSGQFCELEAPGESRLIIMLNFVKDNP